MKKIFLLLFFIPVFVNAQTDNFIIHNCSNFPVNDYFVNANKIFINSQNTPLVINQSDNLSTLNVVKYVSGVWSNYTLSNQVFESACIGEGDSLYLLNGPDLLNFDGNSFSNLNYIFNGYGMGMTYDKADSLIFFIHVYNENLESLNPYNGILDTLNISGVNFGNVDEIFYRNQKLYFGESTDMVLTPQMYIYDMTTFVVDTLIMPFSGNNYSGYFSNDRYGNIYFTSTGSDFLIYKIDPTTLIGDTLYSSNVASSIGEPTIVAVNPDTIWCNDGADFIGIFNGVKSFSIPKQFHLTTDSFPIITLEEALAVDSSGNIWGRCSMQTDALNTYYGLVFQFNSKGFSNIIGKIYSDQNSNGVYDLGEILLQNQIVYHNQNSFANSNDSGNYYLKFIDSSFTYNVQPIIPNYWQCQSNCSYTVTPSVQLNSNYDFGLTPSGNFDDLNVAVTSYPARSGFTIPQNIFIKNVGTTLNTSIVNYQFDSQESFLSSNPIPSSISGNILTWNLNSLTPFQQTNIQLWLSLPISIPDGTPLTSIVSVQSSGTENTPADNIDSLNQTVTGSFDPNEKTVSPSGNINSGDWLTYTIYFQNTGTDTAFNIDVLDTLNNNLDFSTISIVGFSHPMTWQIKGAGYLKFSFNNILLPDSNTNESLSHGYVSYRIKSKSGLVDGTLIHNTASIYFDFNSSIVTNTTSTLIGSVGIADVNENNFSIFPSIITSGETIQINHVKIGDELKLIDCTGRILSSEKIISSSILFQTKNLSSGIYFIQYHNAVSKLVVL